MRFTALLILAVATVVAVEAASPVRASSASRRACAGEYGYAGMIAPADGAGISARVAALAPPRVAWGHVAGWIGVGGPGEGPGGADEWLQVGLSGFEGGASSLYYEVSLPGSGPRYTQVVAQVAPREWHTVAVLEVARRRDWWRVWVDGAPVGKPMHLPGSHGRWQPMAMGESWNGGRHVCNDFRYAFRGLRVASAPGGSWHALVGASVLERGGRVLNRRGASFVAAA